MTKKRFLKTKYKSRTQSSYMNGCGTISSRRRAETRRMLSLSHMIRLTIGAGMYYVINKLNSFNGYNSEA